MDTALALISFVSSTIYIGAMVWLFYLFATAKTKEDLAKVVSFAKLPIVMAVIGLLTYLLRADLAYSLMSLVKVAGPIVMAWSSTLRMKVLPKTREELLIEEIERDLYKF